MKRPQLVFVMGIPGAGKTTLGQRICKELGYTFIDNDLISSVVTNELCRLNNIASDDRDSVEFIAKVKPFERSILFNTIVANLNLGVSVLVPTVLTGCSDNQTWLDTFLEEYKLTNVDVRVVHLEVPSEEVIYNRIVTRNHPRDNWKRKNWGMYYRGIKNYKIAWDVPTLRIDNTDLANSQVNLQKAITFLKG